MRLKACFWSTRAVSEMKVESNRKSWLSNLDLKSVFFIGRRYDRISGSHSSKGTPSLPPLSAGDACRVKKACEEIREIIILTGMLIKRPEPCEWTRQLLFKTNELMVISDWMGRKLWHFLHYSSHKRTPLTCRPLEISRMVRSRSRRVGSKACAWACACATLALARARTWWRVGSPPPGPWPWS